MKIVSSIILLLGLLLSCQSPQEKAKKENKFSWNAGISAPKNYPSAPFVEYFYHGKSVAGASTGIGNDPGWGITMGGYSGGDNFKQVPDSVYVKWRCGFDLILYEGGSKLPRKKMLKLFNEGAINPYNGKKDDYTVLVAGTAPGGNVAIWMKAGQVITEVLKFKAEKVGQEGRYDLHTITLWTSTGKEAKDILTYINLHGVPYKIWETGDKEYNYDIVFCNEADKTNYDRRITGYSKDGSIILHNSNGTDFKTVKWDKRFDIRDKNLNLQNKLPVHIFLQWSTKDNKQWCESEIVLPKKFESYFKQSQTDSKTGQKEQFDRIVIGLEKEDPSLSYIFGRIWVSGENYQKEIMRFRAAKFDTINRIFLVSKYSLPKGFVFPKWEGREPLKAPEIEYWQEK